MTEKETKHIFVTGGVISGLGKGIACASIGYLLKSWGFKVTIQKFDPYINIDPGTMSPCQHGEVFVLDDGAETDLDLGHYERFIDVDMSADNNTTTGQVYNEVIGRERRGDYLGATVQIIPHVTDEIKRRIVKINRDRLFDIVITEVGGTVGDIEGLPFLEAIRQFRLEKGHENCINIHLTLVPYIETSGEDPIMVSREDFNNIRFYLNLDIAERGINTNGIRLPTESQEYFRKMIVNIHTFIM